VVTQRDLGRLLRAGDAQTLAATLERCRPSLYGTAVGVLGNRADAHDAVQDTFVLAMLHLGDLREVAAAGAWLHAIVRNVCLMRIRQRRELPYERVEPPDARIPGPEEALDKHVLRDSVWRAIDELSSDERVAVMLRYFTRCTSYEAIATVTAVPIGTVRSRLNRARSRLANALVESDGDAAAVRDRGEGDLRQQWEGFYRTLHEHPSPRTYEELFRSDVDVGDRTGHWVGVEDWAAHERGAIALGVRATIVGLLASTDVTVLEIDFANPPAAPHHCPPHATFIHRLHEGRSRQLRIHYTAT
jgi:RNA polymerase sigma-70 factor (ECF subfamily)